MTSEPMCVCAVCGAIDCVRPTPGPRPEHTGNWMAQECSRGNHYWQPIPEDERVDVDEQTRRIRNL